MIWAGPGRGRGAPGGGGDVCGGDGGSVPDRDDAAAGRGERAVGSGEAAAGGAREAGAGVGGAQPEGEGPVAAAVAASGGDVAGGGCCDREAVGCRRSECGGTGERGRRGEQMAGVVAGSVRAGSLPVWTGPAAGQGRPGSVRVSMASRAAAAAAGVSGVIFSVARADGKAAAAGVHVSLDYGSFAYADGGDYAARLRLVELPACVLTTPKLARCRTQTPVRSSADDVATSRLGAERHPARHGHVRPPPAVVLAATTPTSGSAGDFSATPLSEAGTWAEGGAERRVHVLVPDQRAAGARRPGPAGQPGLQLPGRGRADVVDEQPGVVDRRRLGLPAGLYRAGLPDLLGGDLAAVGGADR